MCSRSETFGGFLVTDRGFEVEVDEGIPVRLPSGATFLVLTDSEKQYVEERVERYEADNKFKNVSDKQDEDKMIYFELFMHRWSLWMSKGVDYYNDPVDAKVLAQQLNSYSTELRLLKKNLGIDKVARDRQRGDDSVAAYLDNLRMRAKEFGIMRNKQSAKSIELFQQLKSLLLFHDNCDELEQRENACTVDDVMSWIREFAIPEFDALDDDFKKNQQSQWIRRQ